MWDPLILVIALCLISCAGFMKSILQRQRKINTTVFEKATDIECVVFSTQVGVHLHLWIIDLSGF